MVTIKMCKCLNVQSRHDNKYFKPSIAQMDGINKMLKEGTGEVCRIVCPDCFHKQKESQK